MNRAVRIVAGAIGTLSVASVALAQQPRKIGVVMGYPAAAGVVWHLSDGIALRPDVSVSRQRIETTTTVTIGNTQTFTSSIDTWNTSLGISALFYLGEPENLRFYVSPRVAWLWTRSEAETSPELPTLGPRRSDVDGYLVSGAFGGQYAPADRFRIFGELGLAYSDQDDEGDFAGSRVTNSVTGFGLRSGVGVVLYF